MSEWRRRLSAALLSILLGAGVAHADVVRLKVGPDLFGQGWMFLDTDGFCKVVTAGHVVRAPDGKIRKSLALDGHGHEWPTGAPLVLSTDPDIAVLPVPSANDPSSCGAGRLSTIGVERRVADMTGGEIVTTGQSEVVAVPVTRRASAMDAGGGELFTVRPTLQADRVVKGWSGSIVRDADGPLGVVFEVDPDHNEAYAVRVDVVRGLIAAASARTTPSHVGAVVSRPAIAVLAGTTIDPANGPEQGLADSGSAWRVVPIRHAVVFTASFATPVEIREVSVGNPTTSANRIEAIGISTQAAAGMDDWTDANYCRAQGGAPLTCRFLARTVLRLRVFVKTTNDDPIALAGLFLK